MEIEIDLATAKSNLRNVLELSSYRASYTRVNWYSGSYKPKFSVHPVRGKVII